MFFEVGRWQLLSSSGDLYFSGCAPVVAAAAADVLSIVVFVSLFAASSVHHVAFYNDISFRNFRFSVVFFTIFTTSSIIKCRIMFY